jgi:amino acid permease
MMAGTLIATLICASAFVALYITPFEDTVEDTVVLNVSNNSTFLPLPAEHWSSYVSCPGQVFGIDSSVWQRMDMP